VKGVEVTEGVTYLKEKKGTSKFWRSPKFFSLNFGKYYDFKIYNPGTISCVEYWGKVAPAGQSQKKPWQG